MDKTSPCKILLIEDDLPLASLICQYLQQNHCDIFHVSTGEETAKFNNLAQFDIVICDVMLPDITGFELFKLLKAKSQCPILFLTALDESKDQIFGLELGAADYIVKPIDPKVLLARIKMHLRKPLRVLLDKKIIINDLIFDGNLKQIQHMDTLIPFTIQEFEVLYILAQHHLEIVPREHLFKQVIGREYNGLDRAIDLIISRLRKRLDELQLNFIIIRSIRNKGYLFNCNN